MAAEDGRTVKVYNFGRLSILLIEQKAVALSGGSDATARFWTGRSKGFRGISTRETCYLSRITVVIPMIIITDATVMSGRLTHYYSPSMGGDSEFGRRKSRLAALMT